MASLQVLRLENNRIDALPDNIGSCKALVKLDLSTNNLHSLPDSMGQFRKLQRLNVANNMLRRVPASMGGLKTLKELDLRYWIKASCHDTCCIGKFAAQRMLPHPGVFLLHHHLVPRSHCCLVASGCGFCSIRYKLCWDGAVHSLLVHSDQSAVTGIDCAIGKERSEVTCSRTGTTIWMSCITAKVRRGSAAC